MDRPQLTHWLRRLLKSVCTIYLGVLVLLVLLETMLVYPAPRADKGDWNPESPDVEDVRLRAEDGTSLHGWFIEHPEPKRVILLLHGNGENVAYLGDEMDFIRSRFEASVLAFDYRGYGKSDGRPEEAGILSDGEAAHAWLANRTGLKPEQVVLWGRSLGGAVGVHLAATNGARVLILDRTFSSLADTASSHYPWVPVRLLMRNRYPSQQRIQAYRGPVFQVHGHPDQVIPFRLGRRLFDAAPSSDKHFRESATLTHNDPWPAEFYSELAEFLSSR